MRIWKKRANSESTGEHTKIVDSDIFETAISKVGIEPETFYNMTPYEYQLKVAYLNKVAKDRLDEKIYLAHTIEAFHRTKRLKKLKQYLMKEKNKVMSDLEMLEEAKRLTMQFGGTISENGGD